MDKENAKYTSKQMGDACEMLVAAELTLAGVPAMKAPDFWPGYDVIAQPAGLPPQRISVKSRKYKDGAAYFRYYSKDQFDWIVFVILPGGILTEREFYVVPRAVADEYASKYNTKKTSEIREYAIYKVAKKLGRYQNNFGLAQNGKVVLA